MKDHSEKLYLGEGRLKDLKEKSDALLVGIYPSTKDKLICEEHLDELESLGNTYGLNTVEKMPTPIRKFDSATFVGKGKVEEIRQKVIEKNIDIVVFDDELAPHQQRNLEKILACLVIDRTELILGVFDEHARTKEAKIQVDLARFRYQLPRLKRMWTHLERQRISGGAGGYLKGAGEKQIEIDRRLLKTKIQKLQNELKKIVKQREIKKRARKKTNIPTFAIIGYTNAGKSTLLNGLTGAGVLVEDKLFATLDTTTRKFTLPNNQDVLLIDTVGFIRKLPHQLVAAFKSTLEEALDADILLHLIDVSNPSAFEHADATYSVLKELDVEDPNIITCLNKIDLGSPPVKFKLKYPKTVEISTLEKIGFDDLVKKMMEEVQKLRQVIQLKIPQSQYHLVSEVMRKGNIISCDYEDNDVFLEAEIPKTLEKKVKKYTI